MHQFELCDESTMLPNIRSIKISIVGVTTKAKLLYLCACVVTNLSNNDW